MTLAVETVPVSDLTPHPDNPRRGDVTAIAESLEANSQVVPIVVARDNVILSGNHTWQAAQRLGWDSIQVTRLDVASDSAEARRVMLALNRTADMAGYDDAELARLLEVLADEDTLLGTGYGDDDLADLLLLTQTRETTEVIIGTPNATYGHDGGAVTVDGVAPDPGIAGRRDAYMDKAVRNVILAYSLEDFAEVTTLLVKAREDTGTESNADAVLAVLRNL